MVLEDKLKKIRESARVDRLSCIKCDRGEYDNLLSSEVPACFGNLRDIKLSGLPVDLKYRILTIRMMTDSGCADDFTTEDATIIVRYFAKEIEELATTKIAIDKYGISLNEQDEKPEEE